ncbi:Mak11 protein [Saccharomycopsis crataegensis]|uniref:Mak11 protein n=1 Tax=Saccharomycopsis crataegensis TaxID=43959 RepID=A0AAV5QNG3_9ASCO|nr:Mak11 protein [Saccharomycopsis crataegensis]
MAEPNSNQGNLTQFRILTGSYEHNLLCLSLIVPRNPEKTPVFQPIFHFESHSLSIYSISSSKRYLVTGSKDEHVKIYDLQKRKELGDLLAHQGSVNTLKFSNNGKWLLSGSNDNTIIIWGVQDWELFGKLKGHKDAVNDLAIHPSNKIAISCSNDNTLRLWNLMTVKKAAVLKLKYKITKAQKPQIIRWSLEGNYFVVALMNRVLIYDTNTSKVVHIMKMKHTIMHMEIYKIKEVEYLVISLNNASIEFFDLHKVIDSHKDDDEEEEEEETKKPDEPEFRLIGHASRVKDFKLFQPSDCDTVFFISISSDGKIVVWNMDTKDQIAVYDAGERLNCVEVVPEAVEKTATMRKRQLEATDSGYKTESEYETDGEGSRKILFGTGGNKKKRTKNKKMKRENKASVEIE